MCVCESWETLRREGSPSGRRSKWRARLAELLSGRLEGLRAVQAPQMCLVTRPLSGPQLPSSQASCSLQTHRTGIFGCPAWCK